MKHMFLIIPLIFLLQSCGQKKDVSQASSYKNKIVLGAFNDMTSASTLNLEALTDYPDEVDLSETVTPVKNQGQRGTCTFFAATALIESALKIDKGIEANLSEEYMIYSTKNQGYYEDVEASHISVNLEASKKGGILLERDWNYMPDWFGEGKPCHGLDNESDETPVDCFVHKPSESVLQNVIPATALKTGFIRKNTNEIIKFLATNRRPLTISLPVNYNGWSDTGKVIYNEKLRQQCLAKPEECGAHSVILVGYNIAEQVFYFKNSWSDTWGAGGFGTLSFEMVDRYVDGYLYYAKIDGDIAVPSDFKVNKEFSVKSVTVKPVLNENKLTIDVNVVADKMTSHFFEVRNVLAIRYYDEFGEMGLDPVELTYVEQVMLETDNEFVYGVSNPLQVDFTGQTDMHTIVPESVLNAPSVQKKLQDPDNELVIVTSIFAHTDGAQDFIEVSTPVITPVTK